MALKKIITNNGIACEYHTPIIMQDDSKHTKIAISSWVNEQAYLDGMEPLRSRVDSITMDSKYPTAEEIYTAIKKTNPSEWDAVQGVEAGEEGYIKEEDFVPVEQNVYADAEDLI